MDITPENIINPPPETYRARASCGNCDHEWTVDVQRGIPMFIKEKSLECPHCGCDRIYLKSLK